MHLTFASFVRYSLGAISLELDALRDAKESSSKIFGHHFFWRLVGKAYKLQARSSKL